MPSRVVRGEINASRSLERVSMLADLTFRALLVAVDDFGRIDGRLHVLRATIFPTRPDVTDRKLDGWLAELEREGCVRRYVVDGGEYLCLPQWEKHVAGGRKANKSRFPDPPDTSQEILGDPRKSSSVASSEKRVASSEIGADAPARSARAKRGKLPPPEDLEPSEHEALEGWCRGALGRPDLVPRLRALVQACLTFHRAKGNVMASWYAAVQTWVRNEAEGRFGRPQANQGNAPPAAGSRAERRARAQQLYAVDMLLPEPTEAALERWEREGSPMLPAWWLPEAERVRLRVVS